jgi:hypothetical protein
MPSVAVIINSCHKFHEVTIPTIIASAKNIPAENIYVVVGESDKETDIVQTDTHNIVYCKYVNIDFNGYIYFTQTARGLEELNKYTHFFYIHDTSLFMDHFWEKINRYAETCDSYIKQEEQHTKNMGLFNVKWFIHNRSELLSHYTNTDKTLALKYKEGNFHNKDYILSRFKNIGHNLNENSIFYHTSNGYPFGEFFQNPNKRSVIEKKYSGEDRMRTEYDEPGIVKFQKNWGQGGWNLQL